MRNLQFRSLTPVTAEDLVEMAQEMRMRTQIANQQSQANTFASHTFNAARMTEVEGLSCSGADAELSSPAAVAERDALILEHMAAVRYIARRIHERLPNHVELNDLVSAGLVGLLDAANKFDYARDVQFKSYAQFRIRGAILDSLRMLDWSPRDLRRKGRQMAEAIRSLSTALGRAPLDSEVAEEMGLSLVTFHQMTGELKGTEMGSLDAEHTEDAGDADVNFVAAPAAANPLALCIQSQTREQLTAAIAALPEKERLVVTLSYFEELTLKEIGLVLGVVESRVCQIRSSAVTRLRKQLTRRGNGFSSRIH